MKNFAHKDFEFVNLFFLKNYESHLQCGIIDFQSAFIGFIGWDLLSLLENPRIDFTRDYNDKLIEYFYDNTSIIENLKTFREQYYVLSLARQTRLLGRWKKLLSLNNDNQYLDYFQNLFFLKSEHFLQWSATYEKHFLISMKDFLLQLQI